jgi:hypothetical protein
VAIGPAEWVVRAGYLRNQKWDEMAPPVYGSLGMAVSF